MDKKTSEGNHVEYHIENRGTFIHNIEHIEHFHGRLDNKEVPGDEDAAERSEDLHNDLLPMFNGKGEQVDAFLKTIGGVRMNMIPKVVNLFVEDGQINKAMRHKPMYEVLKKHGIYTLTGRNWNDQVK